MDHQGLTGSVFDREHFHLGQAHQQRTHARRVSLQQGLSRSVGVENRLILEVPVPRPVDGQPTLTLRSVPKRHFAATLATRSKPSFRGIDLVRAIVPEILHVGHVRVLSP